MFVVWDLVLEEARIHAYATWHEDIGTETKYKCNMSVDTHPYLEVVVTTAPDPYAACKGAHALAVLTDRDEFKRTDNAHIYTSMTKPAFVFNGRNILGHNGFRELGFKVHTITKLVPNTLLGTGTVRDRGDAIR